MDNQLKIIIPAAGLGRRMKSYGSKSLIDLGNGKLVITRQIDILKNKFPTAEIVVVIGFDAEKICKVLPDNVRVVENELYEETNVVRSIGLGIRAAGMNCEKALIVYGDLVFNEDTFNYNLDESNILVDNKNQMRDFEVGVTTVDNYVSQMSYGLPTKWAQIAYLTNKELSLFKQLSLHKEHRKYYGFEVINLCIKYGGRFKTIEPDGMRIAEIDNSKDIEEAKKLAEEYK